MEFLHATMAPMTSFIVSMAFPTKQIVAFSLINVVTGKIVMRVGKRQTSGFIIYITFNDGKLFEKELQE